VRSLRNTARYLIRPGLVLGLFIIDRLSKEWALKELAPRYEIKVLPFFSLTYVENTGAAWGMLPGKNTILIVISLALLGAILYMRRRWKEDQHWLQYGSLLVVAGAVGNLYDRIAYKFVVDFLDFYIAGVYHWPVFNVADSCITVGAACLAWGMHLEDRAARKAQASA
jgi:signal peptidase II